MRLQRRAGHLRSSRTAQAEATEAGETRQDHEPGGWLRYRGPKSTVSVAGSVHKESDHVACIVESIERRRGASRWVQYRECVRQAVEKDAVLHATDNGEPVRNPLVVQPQQLGLSCAKRIDGAEHAAVVDEAMDNATGIRKEAGD